MFKAFKTLLIRTDTAADLSPRQFGPRCRSDALHPELRFRVLLTGGAPDLGLTLV